MAHNNDNTLFSGVILCIRSGIICMIGSCCLLRLVVMGVIKELTHAYTIFKDMNDVSRTYPLVIIKLKYSI